MAKDVKFSDSARQLMLDGVNVLADAVKVTRVTFTASASTLTPSSINCLAESLNFTSFAIFYLVLKKYVIVYLETVPSRSLSLRISNSSPSTFMVLLPAY